MWTQSNEGSSKRSEDRGFADAFFIRHHQSHRRAGRSPFSLHAHHVAVPQHERRADEGVSGSPPLVWRQLTARRVQELLESYQKGGGRPLEELLDCKEPLKDRLKGAEAQRLRSSFSSYGLHPADCDDFEFVAALMTSNLAALKKRWLGDLQADRKSVV